MGLESLWISIGSTFALLKAAIASFRGHVRPARFEVPSLACVGHIDRRIKDAQPGNVRKRSADCPRRGPPNGYLLIGSNPEERRAFSRRTAYESLTALRGDCAGCNRLIRR